MEENKKSQLVTFLSEDENIINGVPQGSILGPLLFLLFINDLPLYTDKVATDLYADDTTLYTTAKSIQEIKKNLQQSLISLHKWCKDNGMVLSREKTKVMLITTKQRRIHLNIEELSLNYNDEQLNVISGDKILGVYVDNNLAFSGHIDNTAKKITSNI